MTATTAARTPWTPAEDAALRAAYAGGGLPAARRALPGRTRGSLKNRVHQLGLRSPPRFWTPAEDALLRELYPAGVSAPELARRLGRPVAATKRRVWRLGLESGRAWPAEAVEAVRARYRADGAAALARELLGADGEAEVWRVCNLAFRLGVTAPVRHTPAFLARVRELRAAGLNDRRIAAALVAEGLSPPKNARERVTAARRRMGLPRVEQTAADRRAMGRKGYEVQRAALGGENARTAAHRALAARYGLPADLPPRAVQIVVALAAGPKTRAGLEAAGCVPCSTWNALKTTYAGGLVARGLVARAGRPATYLLTPAALDLLAKGGGDADAVQG